MLYQVLVVLFIVVASSNSSANQEISICAKVNKSDGSLLIGSPLTMSDSNQMCGPNQTKLTWNVVGPKGDDGKDGRDGTDGIDGPDGKDGKDGLDGAPGAAGDDGVDGVDGIDGLDGLAGIDGSSCSVQQEESTAVITCKDGTSAIIASAGTVVTYPYGTQGEIPFAEVPSGAVVVVDAVGTVLGEISPWFFGGNDYFNLLLAPGKELTIFNDHITQTIQIQLAGDARYVYLEEDCMGQPFFQRGTFGIFKDYISGELFVRDPTEHPELGTALIKSQVLYSCPTGYDPAIDPTALDGNPCQPSYSCQNLTSVTTLVPTVRYYPSEEFLNAVYPASLTQLAD